MHALRDSIERHPRRVRRRLEVFKYQDTVVLFLLSPELSQSAEFRQNTKHRV